MSGQAVVGLDIGGTKIAGVLLEDGVEIAASSVSSPAAEGGDAIVAASARLIERLTGGERPGAVGVGAAGVLEPGTGTVVTASDSFRGWAGFRLRDALAASFGVPVVLENDVNAFLLGELLAGAVRGRRDAVGIALGTGVGGAIVLDGEIVRGRRGAAGEIGHTPGHGDLPCTCGQRGHLETLASGRSIERRFAARTGLVLAGAMIADRARDGDTDAARIMAEAGQAVGRAIVTAANLLDIDAVVIGGGVSAAWDLLAPEIDDVLRTNPAVSGARIDVCRAQLGHSAATRGAAELARRHLLAEGALTP